MPRAITLLGCCLLVACTSSRRDEETGPFGESAVSVGDAGDDGSAGDDDGGTALGDATAGAGDDTGSGGGGDDGPGPVTAMSNASADDGADDGGDDGPGATVDIAPEDMIDDLDDGDGVITPQSGRQGAWYTYNDESAAGSQSPAAGASLVPEAGGPAGSVGFAHTSGSGFTEWGAGVGLDLDNPGDGMGGAGVKNPWDASAFTGVAFWAKGNVQVRFKLQTAAVVPAAQGGTCAETCDDAHGKAIMLPAAWTQIVVPFSELAQEGWGTAAAFDPATAMGLQWQAAAGASFDVQIDEVGFY